MDGNRVQLSCGDRKSAVAMSATEQRIDEPEHLSPLSGRLSAERSQHLLLA